MMPFRAPSVSCGRACGSKGWRVRSPPTSARRRIARGCRSPAWAATPRDAVTPSDLLAVSLLDIAWRPEAVRQLLGTSAATVSGLLSAIRSDVDLWEASDEDLAAVDPLWDALLQMPGVGTATASKLLARKRSRLCPVSDKVVIGAVGAPGWTWEALRTLLQDPAARAEIGALRPPSAAVVSLLRILDMAIWIRHSHSRAASRIRRGQRHPRAWSQPPVTQGATTHANLLAKPAERVRVAGSLVRLASVRTAPR